MAVDTVAPWAEPAPITADLLLALPEDSWRYELIEGRLVRMPPVGFEHGDLEAELGSAMREYAREHQSGRVVVGETGFLLSPPGELETVLAPDIAFVTAPRVPPADSAVARGFPRLCPDLVVEIASPSQGRSELGAKARLWLSYGARLVWILWPDAKEVEVWRPGQKLTPETLTVNLALDGEDVLPGFQLPLNRLFG